MTKREKQNIIKHSLASYFFCGVPRDYRKALTWCLVTDPKYGVPVESIQGLDISTLENRFIDLQLKIKADRERF